MRVAGIDGWKSRWAIIILADGVFDDAIAADSLGQFLNEATDLEAIGIDMPIGLPVSGVRRADSQARTFVAPRSSSVFSAPPPDILKQDSYQVANRLSMDKHGRGISKQAYNLKPKIEQVADHITSSGSKRLHEVHPEVSFRQLAGHPLSHAKKTWQGQRQRINALASAGILLPDDLGQLGSAPVDDILDAGVVAWTAHRIATGIAQTLPADPEQDEPVIWY